jgi:hypothetical protein
MITLRRLERDDPVGTVVVVLSRLDEPPVLAKTTDTVLAWPDGSASARIDGERQPSLDLCFVLDVTSQELRQHALAWRDVRFVCAKCGVAVSPCPRCARPSR